MFSERRTKVSDKDYAPLSVARIGVVPQLATAVKTDAGDNRKLVCKGDFVINSRSDRKGSCGVADRDGSVSLINIVLTPRNEWNNKYVHYLMRSQPFSEEYYRYGRGIVADLWTTRYSEMKSILLPIPPRTEQDQIVRFLDWKVSAINRLIGIKRKEIVALEELKQCQINEAIADIENLGDTMQRLKTFSSCNQLTLGDSTAPNYTFRYVDIGSVDAKKGITKYEQMVFSSAPSRARRIVRKDDIIISTVRTYLRAITKISDEDNVIVSTGFAVITAKNEYSKYIEYCFKTDRFCNEVVRCSIGIAYPSINTPVLMNLSIPIPNYDTQISTANRLDDISKKIDKQIENKEKYIISLAELKTRLIADTVTGKIDVRNIEIPEYEFVGEESQAEEEFDAEGSDNGE